MALAEPETQRRGLDLALLPGRIAHERSQEIGAAVVLAAGGAPEQRPRRASG